MSDKDELLGASSVATSERTYQEDSSEEWNNNAVYKPSESEPEQSKNKNVNKEKKDKKIASGRKGTPENVKEEDANDTNARKRKDAGNTTIHKKKRKGTKDKSGSKDEEGITEEKVKKKKDKKKGKSEKKDNDDIGGNEDKSDKADDKKKKKKKKDKKEDKGVKNDDDYDNIDGNEDKAAKTEDKIRKKKEKKKDKSGKKDKPDAGGKRDKAHAIADIDFGDEGSRRSGTEDELELINPYAFYMNPGSIDTDKAAAVGSSYLDVSNSSSAEDLQSVNEEAGPVVKLSKKSAFQSKGKHHDELSDAKQFEELSILHKKMLEMQKKNLELTRAVAEGGAATAAAVKALMDSQKKGGKLQVPDFDFLHDHGGIDDLLPPTPTPVFIKSVFLRIMDIDTLAQQFEAEVYIEARWQERKFQGLSMAALSKIEFHDCWDPRLKILNIAGDLAMDKTSMVLRYEPDSVAPVLVYMWHLKGSFKEKMELQHFPFDVQELSLAISSDLPATHVDLLEDTHHDSSVNLGALQESEDWKNYRHVEFSRDVTLREMESTSKHPVLVVAAHAKRRLGSYFWNVAVIVFLILALTFTLLAVEPFGNDRLSIIMTLFLTAVAFKLVVKSSLPTISYLTYLDMYVIFSLAYLFMQGAESAMMLHLARFRDPVQVKKYDEIAQSILIAFLILFHLILIVYIQFTVLARRRRMIRLDYDFEMSRIKRKKARLERQEAATIAEKAHLT